MKLKFIILFSLICLTLTQLNIIKADQVSSQDRPLLIIVLMVKNEEHIIRETLQPYVDAGIQNYLIFDTGSTDKTVEVTEEFFKNNNIQHGIIKQEPFIDFSTSRNRALDLTEENFPTAHFMLMVDAEWFMHGVPDLLEFCKNHKDETCPTYLVKVIDEKVLDYHSSRLIRLFSNSRYSGVVHEVISNSTDKKVPSNVFLEFNRSNFGIEKSRKRWLRDQDLLLKEHEKNPKDARTVFYLAQTYESLNDLENAAIYYEKRVNTPGWDEENFVALYRLAKVYEGLKNWEKALNYYIKAFSYRPKRIEPLVKIAQHYLNTAEYDLCYFFAKRACEAPYPDADILFIEKNLYDFSRYDLLGVSAWYVKEYAIGKAAILKGMQNYPNSSHFQKNLEYYSGIIS